MTNRMIIGSIDRSTDQSTTRILRFEAKDRAFKPLASYLMALHAFAGLLEIYKPDEKGARRWERAEVALFDAAACDTRLTWSPHHVVEPMVWNTWPPFVEFKACSAEPIPAGTVLNLGVLEHYLAGLGQALLTNFFENQKSFLTTTFGKVANWPPIWNFARVVRNAMAHDGKIRIDDRTVVKWNRLSYSSADNGRAAIHVDIWPADIFLLLKQMEAALDV